VASEARQLERNAVHEAGHVIAARAAGVRVVRVVADSDGGLTSFAGPLGLDLDEVRIRVAGAVAETLAFGGSEPHSDGRSDRVEAERAAFAVAGDLAGVDELLASVRSEVRGLLFDRWGDVGRVAKALIDRGALTAEDLEQPQPRPEATSFLSSFRPGRGPNE